MIYLGNHRAQKLFLILTLLPGEALLAQSEDENVSFAAPRALSRQQDENRPEGQFETEVLGRPLTIGGEYEFNPERRQNLILSDDADDEDKLIRLEHKFELEAFYDAGNNTYLFAETKLKLRTDSRNDAPNDSATTIERGEMWTYFHAPKYGFGIQVGRQNFKDKREWWWDADLDAIRFRFERNAWSGDFAAAKEIAGVSSVDPIHPEEDGIGRLIGNVQWRWADRQSLDLFWLRQRDRSSTPEESDLVPSHREDEFDADLDWLGLRARGTFKLDLIGRIYYWADFGMVSGTSSVIDHDDDPSGLRIVDDIDEFAVDGSAFDIGATWRWETDRLGETNITLGFAKGSGDSDLSDDLDTSFHQSGLQDNNGKFRGASRFRYYGELFRPELSNMIVTTFSVGKEFQTASSVEIAYHNYRQVNASDNLRDSRLRISPLGFDSKLGHEIDVVLSVEEWIHWEVELVGAVFQAGEAFGDAANSRSFLAIAKINYNF